MPSNPCRRQPPLAARDIRRARGASHATTDRTPCPPRRRPVPRARVSRAAGVLAPLRASAGDGRHGEGHSRPERTARRPPERRARRHRGPGRGRLRSGRRPGLVEHVMQRGLGMPTEADESVLEAHRRGSAGHGATVSGPSPRFGILLAAMLSELTVAPFVVMATGTLLVARLLGLIVMVAALSVIGANRTAVSLFVAAVAFHLASTVSRAPFVGAGAELFRLVFLTYVLWLIMRRVLRDRVVTLDTVAGAACVYFLLGLVWGGLFLLFERLSPGSFLVACTM